MRARTLLLIAIVASCVAAGCARRSGRGLHPSPASSGVEGDSRAVLSVEEWSFGNARGSMFRTRHYRLYTTEQSAAILSRMPAFLEASLDHYRSALGPLPAPRASLDTYLMDNRTQWTRLTQMLIPDGHEVYQNIQRGGFAINGIGVYFDLGLYDTHAIAAHEGWHQYVQRSFDDPLPVWLNEGVACYMEGFRWAGDHPVFRPWANVERFDQLRAAIASGELMTLEQLLSATPQELGQYVGTRVLTYYAQVWALVHFLHEGDNEAYSGVLRQLLQDAASGNMTRVLQLYLDDEVVRMRASVGDAVFRAYFGEDLDEISARYEAFVRTIVRPGARDVLIRGGSPVEGQS
ncbi:MAG: DUF1570 domain-containing protein [Phycisphaerales bacterium JB043]